MSLTSMLKGKSDKDKRLQTIIRESIPSKREFHTLSDNDAFSSAYSIEAPYNLNKPHDSSVVGTAFDYLARFIVARRLVINKHSIFEDVTANRGLKIIQLFCKHKTGEAVGTKYEKGMRLVREFIDNKEANFKAVVRYAAFLARLEIISRSGMLPDDVEGSILGREDEKILTDLIRLCEVFSERFMRQEIIKPDSIVVFNPHFGVASSSCGGADADIYIDGTLYDFKTTKIPGYRWSEIAQIFGYYYLNCIAGRFNDQNASLRGHDINRLAFYKARFGEIEYIDISMMSKEKVKLTVDELEGLLAPKNMIREKPPQRMDKHNRDGGKDGSGLLNKIIIFLSAFLIILLLLFTLDI